MITVEQISALYTQRRKNQSRGIAQMRAVRDQYNGDVLIPLPEIDTTERPYIVNILTQGLDQSARRIASTVPDVSYPPTRPGIQVSEQRARDRRRANLGWWEQNRLRLKLRRRARWLIGYSSSPTLIWPDHDRQIPQWCLRDPLSTYPAPSDDPDAITPPDCIFAFRRSYQWLTQRYRPNMAALYKGNNTPKPDDLYDILEYHDENESVLCVLGKHRDPYDTLNEGYASVVELERIPNRAGICPVVAPGMINLDRQQGLFDSGLGMYQAQAKLMAISVIGAYKEVLPETWAIARPNEQVQIITQPDPLKGITGEIRGGEIREVGINMSQGAQIMIDRLERNQRVSGGVPAEFGGESASGIRTGRRGDAVLSATVDFTIQECQEILAASLEEENRRAIAVELAYFGSRPKSFWISWGGKGDRNDYVPNDIFAESDRQTVRYSYAGADANNFVISAGQRLGLGTMSRKTFMEVDPLIPDAEREHDYVISEALEQAQLAALQQQAQAGALPPADLARITELALGGKLTLFQAVQRAQEEAQTRQASEVAPVTPGAPEAQPGLAQPGAGAEAGTVPAGNPNVENLAMMLRSLHASGNAGRPATAPVA